MLKNCINPEDLSQSFNLFVFKFFELTTSCPLSTTSINNTTLLTSLNYTTTSLTFDNLTILPSNVSNFPTLTSGYNFSSSDAFNNSLKDSNHHPLSDFDISNFNQLLSWTSCPHGQLKLVPNDLRVKKKHRISFENRNIIFDLR